MDIAAFNAAKTYGAAKKLLGADKTKLTFQKAESKTDFDPGKIIGGLAESIGNSEKVSAEFMAGRADPHSVVEALASAELAVETAVTLRNKVVEAYQELMRMPV